MTEAARYAVETAFDAAVRYGLLALVAEITTRRLRMSSPAMAHRAWLIVLAAAVLMPLVSAGTPGWVFVQPGGTLAGLGVEAAASGAVVYLAAIYLCGVVAGLVRIAVGLEIIRTLRRSSRPVSDHRCDAILRHIHRWTMRSRRTVILEHDGLAMPVTLGFYRPCVVLPDGWRGWTRSRLDAVLAHELSHVDRGDYATGLLAAAVSAIWWWHPAAWLTASRLSLCAELACDASASVDRDPADYARDLLALAASVADRRVQCAWTPGATSRLSARVDALLTAGAQRQPAAVYRAALVAIMALVALGTCAAGPVKLTPFRGAAGHTTAGPVPTFDHTAIHQARHRGH